MNMCLPQNTEVNMYSEAFVNGMLEAYEAAMKSMLKAKYVSEVSVLSRNAADEIAEFNHTECIMTEAKQFLICLMRSYRQCRIRLL